MSRVGEISDVDSKSGVKMMKGLLVVELFSKSCFVDVVVACGYCRVSILAGVLVSLAGSHRCMPGILSLLKVSVTNRKVCSHPLSLIV
jgi:putative Ca2+/H+ antiporter (TMEM165/GDT1 family)